MKNKTKKLLALLLALITLTSVFAGCGGGNGMDSTLSNDALVGQNDENISNAKETGYIRDKITVAFTGATSLSPWGTSNNTPGNYEVYEDLFEQGIDNVTYPVLADATRGGNNPAGIMGYDHEEGTTLYTVYIWDYIYDHKGNHVTADDVKFSYEYQLANAVTSGWEVLQSVEVVDETTINFTFTRELTGLGEFEQIFTLCFIVDEDTFNNSKSKLMVEMIGTGPYKMKAYVPGSELILERNENYWQTNEEYINQAQKANVRTIDYKFINDSTTRILNFQTGEIDLSDDIESQYTVDFLDGGAYGDKYNVFTYPAGLIMNLWANCHPDSICGDVNMRKAIFYAISTDELVAALGGTDEPAYTYSNNTTGDHNDAWNEMENYNSFKGTPEERKAIVDEYLAAAGYQGETLRLLCQNDMTDFCTILVTMLANYGINAELDATDHAGSTTKEKDPTAWDLEYNKWGGNSYICVKWLHAFSWGNTVEGDHTTNFVYNKEWNDLLTLVNSQEGHTDENLTRWLEILYENAYATNLYNTTKSIIYPEEMTYMYRNSHLIILPGACEYADPNA
ncbi:MAG: ABC transporter substrate-binding protein [Oscillospiraceae bacterium]|nr:ABC transporter substrate-binding protein [Oscillospiraceae bacterium]